MQKPPPFYWQRGWQSYSTSPTLFLVQKPWVRLTRTCGIASVKVVVSGGRSPLLGTNTPQTSVIRLIIELNKDSVAVLLSALGSCDSFTHLERISTNLSASIFSMFHLLSTARGQHIWKCSHDHWPSWPSIILSWWFHHWHQALRRKSPLLAAISKVCVYWESCRAMSLQALKAPLTEIFPSFLVFQSTEPITTCEHRFTRC